MCGRLFLSDARAIVENNPYVLPKQSELFEPVLEPRYNIAPMQQLLAIRSDDDGPRYDVLRWGLVPSWSKSDEHAAKLINARSETILDKPSFRDAIARRRCLIPASGFYEWKADASDSRGGTKQPHVIRRRDHQPFCFAGLWETWIDPVNRQPLHTATICTCPPNDLLRTLHHRMAVILERDQWDDWLDVDHVDAVAASDMLQPCASNSLEAFAVSTRVGNVRNDDASLIEPVEVVPTSLFE
jgi:putative SOS response-associated peptidase YedK